MGTAALNSVPGNSIPKYGKLNWGDELPGTEFRKGWVRKNLQGNSFFTRAATFLA